MAARRGWQGAGCGEALGFGFDDLEGGCLGIYIGEGGLLGVGDKGLD